MRLHRHLPLGFTALVATIALVATACGGGDTTASGGPDADAGDPVYGGRVVYGLEAETSGGYCLVEAQLAISGMQVARALYDTLTTYDANGDPVPFLAESVEANDDHTEFTITLRDGVTFHDGSALTAEVVKNNLDAYRGVYPGRVVLLFRFVFANVADVSVVDPMTVKVTTTTPWPAFPSFLASPRIGMMAQAQLDDPETCATKPIGTGPFMLTDWKVNDRLIADRNPSYWQTDAAGNQLPYLNQIEFRPVVDGPQRVNALETGELTAMHTSGALQIERLRQLADQDDVLLLESEEFTEVSYGLLHGAKPPFDSLTARLAAAYAIDRDTLNQIRNDGLPTVANGPFAPGSVGYVDDTGYPEFDLDKAKEMVAKYEQETGGPLEFTITGANDVENQATMQLVKEMAEAAGAKVSIEAVEQAQLINIAIGGRFQVLMWRNHPGGDPDTQYVWWHSGSPVNFGRFSDPEIDSLLDRGRTETDPAVRATIYEDLNRRFGEQAWNIWNWWTPWAISTAPDVHGILGPPTPDGSDPFPGLATGHPVSGLWVEAAA